VYNYQWNRYYSTRAHSVVVVHVPGAWGVTVSVTKDNCRWNWFSVTRISYLVVVDPVAHGCVVVAAAVLVEIFHCIPSVVPVPSPRCVVAAAAVLVELSH